MTIVELIDEENNSTCRVKKTVLGSNILHENHSLQHVVKRDTWFGCYCDNNNEYSLVGCTGNHRNFYHFLFYYLYHHQQLLLDLILKILNWHLEQNSCLNIQVKKRKKL